MFDPELSNPQYEQLFKRDKERKEDYDKEKRKDMFAAVAFTAIVVGFLSYSCGQGDGYRRAIDGEGPANWGGYDERDDGWIE